MDPQLLTSHYGPRASIYAPLLGPGSTASASASQHMTSSQRAAPLPSSSTSPAVPLTGPMARLAAKQAELEGLRALREQSAVLAKNLEDLSERTDELVNGGEPVANVMASWQGVFRAIMVAQSAIASSRAESIASAAAAAAAAKSANAAGEGGGAGDVVEDAAVGTGTANVVDTSMLGPGVPGTLVRIPVDLDAQQDGDA
ncbi:hypothetical protein CF327_g4558 [Tilletia walkeri]|uniref:DASH complex subunit DAD2 n=1 Tax=Tilletia walkeri TaxID=117179 RepID=A0A8X7T5Z0_9BASI|nr:hypothetical protein CF327_g4558 [Tilletia walkeri]KAE8269759.1 hypothetical protein A4X09_0g2569 [Tilletia walkeri]